MQNENQPSAASDCCFNSTNVWKVAKKLANKCMCASTSAMVTLVEPVCVRD